MTFTNRDKLLALSLLAIGVVVAYALTILPGKRAAVAKAEKDLAATRARVPAEGAEAIGRLRVIGPEVESEQEQLAKERGQLGEVAAALEREWQAIDTAHAGQAGSGGATVPSKPRPGDTAARLAAAAKDLEDGKRRVQESRQQLPAQRTAEKVRVEAQHRAALGRLWVTVGDPDGDRTRRIEQLNRVLARHDLAVIEEADDPTAPIPARIAAIVKTAADTDGKTAPRPRKVRLNGRYANVRDALAVIASGKEIWAVPLGVTMKADETGGSGVHEWVLHIWV